MIPFVWCVRESEQTCHVGEQRNTGGSRKAPRCRNSPTRIDIYVTCAEQFTEPGHEPKECGCVCDKSRGPCCCDGDDNGVDGSVIKAADGGKKTSLIKEASVSSSSSLAQQSLAAGRRMSVLPAMRNVLLKKACYPTDDQQTPRRRRGRKRCYGLRAYWSQHGG